MAKEGEWPLPGAKARRQPEPNNVVTFPIKITLNPNRKAVAQQLNWGTKQSATPIERAVRPARAGMKHALK